MNAVETPSSIVPDRSSNGETMKIDMKQNTSRPKKQPTLLRKLPKDFQPSPNTVIVGNGSRAMTDSPGNRHFQDLLTKESEKYHSSGRAGKSRIVSDVYGILKLQCQHSSPFVKRDGDGFFWELSELAGREKISSSFRNLKSKLYKSSTANKIIRKREARHEKKMERVQKRQRRVESFSRAILSGETYRPMMEINYCTYDQRTFTRRDSQIWAEGLFQVIPDSDATVEPVSQDIFDAVPVEDWSDSFSDDDGLIFSEVMIPIPSIIQDDTSIRRISLQKTETEHRSP